MRFRNYLEMSDEKWLAHAIFTSVRIRADLSELPSGRDGDFQTAALSNVVNTPENNDATFLAWQERAASRMSTLVFCVDVQHVRDLTATFQRHGVEAHYVTGETPLKLRNETVDAFKRRKFPVLLNCSVFTEGTDIPNIDCVLLARPTKSRNLLIQMIGRGARLYEGKEDFHVIDMVSSLKTGVVTGPSLYGLDPDELVDNATADDIRDVIERREKEATKDVTSAKDFTGQLTFIDYASVNDLLQDTTKDRHIRELSPHAWVNVDENRYVLSTNSGSYITIGLDEDRGDYIVTYTVKIPNSGAKRSPYMRPRLISNKTRFENAVSAADTFAREVFPFAFISKTQGWRRGPASEAQIKALNKSRGEHDQLEVGDITKSEANDMITRLKVRLVFSENSRIELTMCDIVWSKGKIRQVGSKPDEDLKSAAITREEIERTWSWGFCSSWSYTGLMCHWPTYICYLSCSEEAWSVSRCLLALMHRSTVYVPPVMPFSNCSAHSRCRAVLS
jgi:ATP-dependent helicase IRC3